MPKKKQSFFCCICGGPFTPDGLRKATTASHNEDEWGFDLFKDYCDCGADNYYGGAHIESCAVLKGYDGDLLSNRRIAWLMNARMICARSPSRFSEYGYFELSLCFVTEVGFLVPSTGFECGGDNGPIRPMEEGFIIHEACWDIFCLAYKSKFPYREPIDVSDLWLSMSIRSPPSKGTVVDWGCSYGGAAKFQGTDWEAWQGSEWLVAEPTETTDFTKIIDASSTDLVPIVPHGTSLLQYRDPFFHLPVEVIHNILEFLSGGSIINLMVASTSVRESGGSLWRARLIKDVPWLQGTSLYTSLEKRSTFIQYGRLLSHLEDVSSSPKALGGLKDEQNWLGLKNRQRIWACCEKILDDVESRFAAARNASGFVSKEMKGLSTFRIATVVKPKKNEERCAANVYFVPTLTNSHSLQTITVYFLPEGSVIGIEFSLDGEQSGRILGHRSTFFQSVTIPSNATINGFILSLGPELPVVRDRPIKGLGILTEDSPLQPMIKFGEWSRRNIVQVFRPTGQFPSENILNQQVVGITGQYNAEAIFTFGIIVALHETRGHDPFQVDIYSRWVEHWPPTHCLWPRHGSRIDDAPYIEPGICQAQSTYVNLMKCALLSVQVYYPHGDGNPIGGLKFIFIDGSYQLVGRAENDPAVRSQTQMALDTETGEQIVGWMGYYGSDTDGSPCNLYSLTFETSMGRSVDLGDQNAIDVEHGWGWKVRATERIIGFQIGDSPPWIEGFSWVLGPTDTNPA